MTPRSTPPPTNPELPHALYLNIYGVLVEVLITGYMAFIFRRGLGPASQVRRGKHRTESFFSFHY